MPAGTGLCRGVPGHPSKHGANREAAWSRPLREEHHDCRVNGLRLSGERRAGAAQAVDTVRNHGRIEPQPTVILVLTIHLPRQSSRVPFGDAPGLSG
jgi:hypothetical protein